MSQTREWLAWPQPTDPFRSAPVVPPLSTRTLAILWVLFLFALGLRIGVALQLGTICRDGVYYVTHAEALEQGDFDAAFDNLGVNVYPAVLASLHMLGVDWEWTGAVSGVVFGSLVIFPLFGWVRRTFDDSRALIAALVYAIHPKLIEWSGETVREPTFWLFLMCATYALYRASTEVRIRWYLIGGLAMGLAILTRTEGWILAIPLVGLTLWKMRFAPADRLRLTGGALVACAGLPCLLAIAYVASGQHPAALRLVRAEHLQALVKITSGHSERVAQDGLATTPMAVETPASVAKPKLSKKGLAAVPASVKTPIRHASTKSCIWKWMDSNRRGLTGALLILLLLGLIGQYRMLFRGDQLVLTAACILVFVGSALHIARGSEPSSRYALTLGIFVLPYVACAFPVIAYVASSIGRWFERDDYHIQRWGFVVATTVLITACCAGSISAVYTAGDARNSDKALGQWIRANYGAECKIIGCPDTVLVGYHAQADFTRIAQPEVLERWLKAVDQKTPDVVVVPPDWSPAQTAELYRELSRRDKWSEINPAELPANCRQATLMMRDEAADEQLAEPARQPRLEAVRPATGAREIASPSMSSQFKR